MVNHSLARSSFSKALPLLKEAKAATANSVVALDRCAAIARNLKF
ncbi:hypothetical protein [Nostoc sp. WHI]|nr:hypothetical protein [Nostoc sp. WHI]